MWNASGLFVALGEKLAAGGSAPLPLLGWDAAYVLAAVALVVANSAIPGAILGLAKIEAHLIRALLVASETPPGHAPALPFTDTQPAPAVPV